MKTCYTAVAPVVFSCTAIVAVLSLLGPQSRFGDKPLKLQVVCPPNGTAVLKGLSIIVAGQQVMKTASNNLEWKNIAVEDV